MNRLQEKTLPHAPATRAVGLPRLGFAGLGWIGRNRMEAALASGVIQVAAVADTDPEAVAAARAMAPDARVCASLDELLEEDIEGVVIATPSAMHAAQSIAALERGLAVFCQKPLGRTAAETESVVAAARSADRLLGVDLSYRYVEGIRLMRDLIQDGEIGDVFSARAVFHNAYGPGKDWFFDEKRSGGGCVIDLGIHLVDLILWALAYPQVTGVSSRLFSQGRPFMRGDAGVEDFGLARLDLSSGTVGEVACSWNLSTGCDAVIELDFHGTRGALALRNVNGSYFDFVVEQHVGRDRKEIASPPDAWGGRALCAWAMQLGEDRSFDESVNQVVDVSAVLDAIYAGTLEPERRDMAGESRRVTHHQSAPARQEERGGELRRGN